MLLFLCINSVLFDIDTDAPSSGNNDIFTSFLSAPGAPSVAPAVAEPLQDGKRSEEENSFFNQPTVDKKPLTKDSIMALYAQSTPVQQPQFPGMSKSKL